MNTMKILVLLMFEDYSQLLVLAIASVSAELTATEKHKKAMEYYEAGENFYKERKYKEVTD